MDSVRELLPLITIGMLRKWFHLLQTVWKLLKQLVNRSTVVGPMDLIVFLSLSIMKPPILQLEIKHIAYAYEVLINLSRESRSATDNQFVQPLTYNVKFETYGGTYHRDTISSNQIAYLGIFLIGNMDTLVVTRGCPEIL